MPVITTWQQHSGVMTCHNQWEDFHWLADTEKASGGTELAPSPHQLLDSALGSCTALTLQLYVNRKNYSLTGLKIETWHEGDPGDYKMYSKVTLEGPLSDEQRADCHRIAQRCSIHRILLGEITISVEFSE